MPAGQLVPVDGRGIDVVSGQVRQGVPRRVGARCQPGREPARVPSFELVEVHLPLRDARDQLHRRRLLSLRRPVAGSPPSAELLIGESRWRTADGRYASAPQRPRGRPMGCGPIGSSDRRRAPRMVSRPGPRLRAGGPPDPGGTRTRRRLRRWFLRPARRPPGAAADLPCRAPSSASTRQSVSRLPTAPKTMNRNATAAGELTKPTAAPITTQGDAEHSATGRDRSSSHPPPSVMTHQRPPSRLSTLTVRTIEVSHSTMARRHGPVTAGHRPTRREVSCRSSATADTSRTARLRPENPRRPTPPGRDPPGAGAMRLLRVGSVRATSRPATNGESPAMTRHPGWGRSRGMPRVETRQA